MPSPEPFTKTTVEPLAPIEHLLGGLATLALGCVLGVTLGGLVARLMRRRELHWSWAGWALAPILFARSAFGGASPTLVVALLWATVAGRRRHLEDLDAGGDLAKLAARRRRPTELLRVRAREAWLRRGRVTRAREQMLEGELLLGVDERSRPVSIPFGGSAGGRHTLVVGATGSGKTVTQTWMASRAIERGMGAVVLDPKGDPEMRQQLSTAAGAAGRAFLEWTPEGDTVYNPYAHGSETEIADKALAGERFTEPHYLRQAQRYMGHAVRALRAAGVEVSLRGMVEMLDPDRLELLLRSLPEPRAEAGHLYLDSLTQRQRSELAGVRDRLAILAESDVGPWLDPQTAGAERFDLLEAVRARAVLYLNLEADTRPLLAQMLGAAIVQDLQTTVAALQGRPAQTIVVIDEFSAVAAEQVVRLFARARSAGISLLLGTQELSDLRPPGRERLLEQVMGNLSVLIAHRQVVPSSAELTASVGGTRGTWKVSRHSDGRTTRTRTRETVLDPGQVTSLRPGWAAVIALGAPEPVRITRVFSAARRG